ncbi:MAG: hypothetical protein KF845_04620 [Cyclobacteriaceae bacterium]|nr:hypothetical protein [Cyclobacteriaceae bacterium]
MNATAKKLEIIKWVSIIEDDTVIDQLYDFKNQKPFNFKEELKHAITGEELKARTTQFLKSLEWKK